MLPNQSRIKQAFLQYQEHKIQKLEGNISVSCRYVLRAKRELISPFDVQIVEFPRNADRNSNPA